MSSKSCVNSKTTSELDITHSFSWTFTNVVLTVHNIVFEKNQIWKSCLSTFQFHQTHLKTSETREIDKEFWLNDPLTLAILIQPDSRIVLELDTTALGFKRKNTKITNPSWNAIAAMKQWICFKKLTKIPVLSQQKPFKSPHQTT